MKEHHEVPGHPKWHYVESEGGSGYYLIWPGGFLMRTEDGHPYLYVTIEEMVYDAENNYADFYLDRRR